MSDSDITIIGGLTRDPELKFLNNGSAVVKLGVAVKKRWMNRQTNEWEERVSYFDVVQYGKPAENVANALHKGSRVVVRGALEQRSWETEDGQKRYAVEINADEIAVSLRFGTTIYTKSDSGAPGHSAPAGAGSVSFEEEAF